MVVVYTVWLVNKIADGDKLWAWLFNMSFLFQDAFSVGTGRPGPRRLNLLSYSSHEKILDESG